MTILDEKDLLPTKEEEQECGTDASGCRLAFDLGKSDIKAVAVKVAATQQKQFDSLLGIGVC